MLSVALSSNAFDEMFVELVLLGDSFTLLVAERKIPTIKSTFTIINAKHTLAFLVDRQVNRCDDNWFVSGMVRIVIYPTVSLFRSRCSSFSS